MKRYRNRAPGRDSPRHSSQEDGGRLLQLLGVLVALCGLVLTYVLARGGHETAGLVAALTVLVPLFTGRPRPP